MYWWGEDTGWTLDLSDLKAYIVAFPFAVLAVAMWSPDFLGHQVFQKISYPPRSERTYMNIDDTMISCSVRQAVGSALGGANFTSSWGTYIVPAAIAKRPIPAGAILTAVFCIVAAIWGYPRWIWRFLATCTKHSVDCGGIRTFVRSRYGNDS